MGHRNKIDLQNLEKQLRSGECTPFIGAAVARAANILPGGQELTNYLIKAYNLPLDKQAPLAQVAQFVAVEQGTNVPKERVAAFIDQAQQGYQPDENDPYRILSRLPATVYFTTNYDDLLEKALRREDREPYRVLLPWNNEMENGRFQLPPGVHFNPEHPPTWRTPWVYHIHGHYLAVESMVITEDDYTDFVSHLMEHGVNSLSPSTFVERLAKTLLVLGYRLNDLTFRVIFKSLLTGTDPARKKQRSTIVQLPRVAHTGQSDALSQEDPAFIELYEKYFGYMNFRVYWGDVVEFLREFDRQRSTVSEV